MSAAAATYMIAPMTLQAEDMLSHMVINRAVLEMVFSSERVDAATAAHTTPRDIFKDMFHAIHHVLDAGFPGATERSRRDRAELVNTVEVWARRIVADALDGDSTETFDTVIGDARLLDEGSHRIFAKTQAFFGDNGQPRATPNKKNAFFIWMVFLLLWTLVAYTMKEYSDTRCTPTTSVGRVVSNTARLVANELAIDIPENVQGGGILRLGLHTVGESVVRALQPETCVGLASFAETTSSFMLSRAGMMIVNPAVPAAALAVRYVATLFLSASSRVSRAVNPNGRVEEIGASLFGHSASASSYTVQEFFLPGMELKPVGYVLDESTNKAFCPHTHENVDSLRAHVSTHVSAPCPKCVGGSISSDDQFFGLMSQIAHLSLEYKKRSLP